MVSQLQLRSKLVSQIINFQTIVIRTEAGPRSPELSYFMIEMSLLDVQLFYFQKDRFIFQYLND